MSFRISRRNFVVRSAALLPAAKILLGRGALTAANLGVQLYTVRGTIGANPAGVLKAIQDIGYREVEATYGNLNQIWPALKETQLKPVSIHLDTALFFEGGAKLDAAIADVKEKGFQFVVLPYIPPAQRGGLDTFQKLADTLNKSGETAKAAGLTLCYHNHAFEFEPMQGTTGLDLLMKETHKDLVSLEMDVFWVSVAGHDPVVLLKKYANRVALLHLKDKASGTPVQYNESVSKPAFKEVGNGTLDFPAILEAAKKTAVKNYFVEQDQTPGDPIESLRESYKYLSGKFAS
jgi:sugar phosphate isomerase/epimerase